MNENNIRSGQTVGLQLNACCGKDFRGCLASSSFQGSTSRRLLRQFISRNAVTSRQLTLAKRLINLTRELFELRLSKMEKDDPSPGASQGGTAKVGSKLFSHITLASNGMLMARLRSFGCVVSWVRNCLRRVRFSPLLISLVEVPHHVAPQVLLYFSTRKSCHRYSPVLLKPVWRSLGLKQGPKCFDSISTAGYMRWFFCESFVVS